MVGDRSRYRFMLYCAIPLAAPTRASGIVRLRGRQVENINLRGAQTGDVKANDIAGNDINAINYVYNVTTSLEQVTKILSEDIQQIESRLSTVETVERQHATERAALTRLITMLATESKTVSDVQNLLERQIKSDSTDRDHRRRYLDVMLSALVILAIANLMIHLYRVFRRSGRAAQL
jgi:hypothetical protein